MVQRTDQIYKQQILPWSGFAINKRKWDDLFLDFLTPLSSKVTHLLDPKFTDEVLDIAWGTGECEVTLASTLKKDRRLKSNDHSIGRFSIGHNRNDEINNFSRAHVEYVHALPFADNTFDVISCRLGFMFFPDLNLTINEMMRVLKPGGKLAMSLWCMPEKNSWLTAIMGTINMAMKLGVPIPYETGKLFQADDGLVSTLFWHAGLKNVKSSQILGKGFCKTTDLYWKMMTENVAEPFVVALSNADVSTKAEVNKKVYHALDLHYPNGNVVAQSNALIIYGEK